MNYCPGSHNFIPETVPAKSQGIFSGEPAQLSTSWKAHRGSVRTTSLYGNHYEKG